VVRGVEKTCKRKHYYILNCTEFLHHYHQKPPTTIMAILWDFCHSFLVFSSSACCSIPASAFVGSATATNTYFLCSSRPVVEAAGGLRPSKMRPSKTARFRLGAARS